MNFPYARISNDIKNNNGLVTALNLLDKAITYITVLFYVGYLIYGISLINQDHGLLLYRSILIPGISFIVVSIYRKVLSSPRPYEVFDFVPAIKKDTQGKSFPSRHVFSIFLISMTYLQTSVWLAVLISVMGIGLAIIRVVGGVHFIKDVLAGAAMAILISVLCYGIFGGFFDLIMLPFY